MALVSTIALRRWDGLWFRLFPPVELFRFVFVDLWKWFLVPTISVRGNGFGFDHCFAASKTVCGFDYFLSVGGEVFVE